MDTIHAFVQGSRANGLTDDQIKELLLANGWTEEQARSVLTEIAPLSTTGRLEQPTQPVVDASRPGPDSAGQTQPASEVQPPSTQPDRPDFAHALPEHATPDEPQHQPRQQRVKHPSSGIVRTMLYYVALWVFTVVSSVMIAVVSLALFGRAGGSVGALLLFLAVELPVSVLFVLAYMLHMRAGSGTNAEASKTWSAVTAMVHAAVFVCGVVALVLALLFVRDGNGLAYMVAATAVMALSAMVVWAHGLGKPAGFASRIFVPVLLAVVAAFSVVAILRIAPLRQDNQMRQQLATAAQAVKEYAKENGALPASLSEADYETDVITYKRQASGKYQLCGVFHYAKDDGLAMDSEAELSDTFITRYDFENNSKGVSCWSVRASDLLPVDWITEPAYTD